MTTTVDKIDAILDELEALYDASCKNLTDALARFASERVTPDSAAREGGMFAYPQLTVRYQNDENQHYPARAYARLNQTGSYSSSIANPKLFRPYLKEQLTHLVRDYPVEVETGLSSDEIPYQYVLDSSALDIQAINSAELTRHFPSSDLVKIGDEVADGAWFSDDPDHRPLALFDALRTDFSLARLRHYSGTPAEHFQRYVLFTNYIRYVEEFIDYALAELVDPGSRYESFSAPGVHLTKDDLENARARVVAGTWRKHQMPAYHLTAKDGSGVTLVNIGVGPSNAKTICDHIAVLRPEVWLMIGHCGGLRPSQTIGDYVLAHAYLRDDNVLDNAIPPEIPIPPIAEVQTAMFDAALNVTGDSEDELKSRLRTGTVVTTDDRNWELHYTRSALRFNQSRAVAIDMESATVAAQGYRFRVPYGTLLCVSDKPLHGEIKLPGQANSFYERSVSQHLRIGIETLALLNEQEGDFHSRKLRSFDEPPLR
ncbi:AMP nucleosidase [Aurantiacibacter gangjinensis]|uniref:AMP nucleosidase n=1 Tax=Aurantiacibacter gangjinensis TaxID=502682 RepID=A0A0G9MVN1_9SPHN|nr:AMP nucleosidase [Aurantiacibacter gangjinensis]APE26873.1 AMP nucleosidase [Aurantiacibacter gangjinensis]KLE33343.1 AMP nucleosidase [Aurantiacibacter gangjinensis]